MEFLLGIFPGMVQAGFLWVAAREASAANHYVTVKCPIDVLLSFFPSFRPHDVCLPRRIIVCGNLINYVFILCVIIRRRYLGATLLTLTNLIC